MDYKEFKERRRKAEIAGDLLCAHANFSRSRLSKYESGFIQLKPVELARLEEALERLEKAKAAVQKAAQKAGLPV